MTDSRDFSIAIEGDQLVIQHGDDIARIPSGTDPVDRMPHIVRAHIDGEVREAFEWWMSSGLGCAGISVRKLK